jgi:hypothetical protein
VIAGLALAAGLALGRSLPAQTTFTLWPNGLSPSTRFEFALTPWSWAVLVCVLAIGLARVLATSAAPRSPIPPSRPAWLLFGSLIALQTVAASPLAVVLAWTAVIAAQTWLVKGQSSSPSSFGWRGFKGKTGVGALVDCGVWTGRDPGRVSGVCRRGRTDDGGDDKGVVRHWDDEDGPRMGDVHWVPYGGIGSFRACLELAGGIESDYARVVVALAAWP